MRRNFLYLFLLNLAILSCKSGGDKSSSTFGKSPLFDSMKSDSARLDSFVRKTLENKTSGILHIVFYGDSMNLVSDEDLTWKPFGVDTDPRKICEKFPKLFSEKDTMYVDPVTSVRSRAVLLRSALSRIFFIRSEGRSQVEVTDTEQDVADTAGIFLYRAEIRDPIIIAYGLKVGMSKREYFERIFGVYDSLLFDKINIITNSDPPGEELDVHFIFNKGVLKEIRMQTP